MSHPVGDLIRGTFAAFDRGDIEALRNQYFADDIRLHVPGRSPLAGDYDGWAQVIGFFGRIRELSEGTFHTELHDVVANDDQAVAVFTLRAERAGRRLEDRTLEIFHVRDGKAAEAWLYPADLYANDEFWA